MIQTIEAYKGFIHYGLIRDVSCSLRIESHWFHLLSLPLPPSLSVRKSASTCYYAVRSLSSLTLMILVTGTCFQVESLTSLRNWKDLIVISPLAIRVEKKRSSLPSYLMSLPSALRKVSPLPTPLHLACISLVLL